MRLLELLRRSGNETSTSAEIGVLATYLDFEHIYTWVAEGPSPRSVDACLQGLSDTHYVRIQGGRCRSLSATLDVIGDALEFPAYYGSNVEALIECLSDLLDLDANGALGGKFYDRRGRPCGNLVVGVMDGQEFMSDESADVRAQMLGSLEYAASQTDREPGMFAGMEVVLIARADLPTPPAGPVSA